MPELIFDLNISSEDFLAWYEGTAQKVFAYARNGQSLSFPASLLQPYVNHNGVSGTFKIEFDEQNKFKSISRISY